MPTISVLMCVYNESIDYIRLAVESILHQTYTNFEFIIIADNPKNKQIISFINDYSERDSRIRILVNEYNIGLAHSLNKGMNVARGEYIARMDADDISTPERLELEFLYIQENNFDMIFALADKIDEKGKVWDKIHPFPIHPTFILEMLPIQNIVVHPTVMMRKDKVLDIGGYRPYSSCQDYDLWLRMLTSNYRIGVLNETILLYRVHEKSVSLRNHYLQTLNMVHIKHTFEKRKKYGMDNFSEEELCCFLDSKRAWDEQISNNENQAYQKYVESITFLKCGKFFKGFLMLFSTLPFYTVRQTIVTTIRAKLMKLNFNR